MHDLSKLSTEEEDKEVQSEALFLKGIAQSKIYDIHAPETFKIFHAQFPEHHNTLWAKDYAGWLRNHAKGRRYALLIGINRYVTSAVPPLAGCLNDVSMMKKVLTQHCNFDETDVFILVDQAATRNGIFDAFKELTKKTTMADTVIIHYSGHSIPEKSKDKAPEFSGTYLIVHDTEFDSKLGICINCITSEDLHGLVSMIPAERKTLILDTHPSVSFIELVKKDGKYALLLASDSAEIAYELQIKFDGEYAQVGAFTSTACRPVQKI